MSSSIYSQSTAAPPAIDGGNKKDASLAEMAVKAEEDVIVDAVWGRLDDQSGPNYRNLGWIRAAVLEIKTQIGLGVLGLSSWLIAQIIVAIIITWSDYVVGTFKLNHPEVYTLADVGFLIGGPIGREILGFAYWLEQTAIAGAGLLSFSVALNAITGHGTCTVAFVVVGAVLNVLFSSIQTLDRISIVGWVGLAGIMSSIITLAVAVGVQDRPSAAPQVGFWSPDTAVARDATFVDAINAVSVVVFAYAGTPNFFNIVGEMKNQRDYTKSVITCQAFVTAVYLIIGCTVYHFVGQYITSPALGSAGPLLKKVCYGLALPGLLVGCVLYTHIPAKYVFVRILRNSRHLSKNTPIHYIVWFSCVIVNCALSFIIAEAIPFFNDLVGLIGALLGTFICIQTEAYMWLWDEWRSPNRGTLKWKALVAMNILFIVLGFFVMIAGTYGSVVAINQSLHDGNTSAPFSCADNSGST
ncbi:hypothetical protein JCM24511_08714 [Saitozyma sp. JCM 24511]|nr:hypothetical protein JCM24511_08714 [Saitozyma sp. JCM 24511]